MADLVDVCEEAARVGGQLLLDWTDRFKVREKSRRDLVTEADLASQTEIRRFLSGQFPDHDFLGEEEAPAPDQIASRLASDRHLWIVDPLDGTREFSEPGRTDWAVHIALAENGVPTAGAVALPAIGITLGTDDPPDLPPPQGGPPRMVVSRTRPPAAAVIVARAIGAELYALGSAGAKAMAVLLGHADIYAHSGGQYEWDNCAPAAVAMAAGCHVSRCDGSALQYNDADPWLPDFVICRPELADDSMAALRRAIQG